MRFTDNASIATDTMVNDDILAGTDVSTGNDRKFTLANLAAWLLNKFTGLSLAGSNQTVKAALDSLNSNLTGKAYSSISALYDALIAILEGNQSTYCTVTGSAVTDMTGGATTAACRAYVMKADGTTLDYILYSTSGRIVCTGRIPSSSTVTNVNNMPTRAEMDAVTSNLNGVKIVTSSITANSSKTFTVESNSRILAVVLTNQAAAIGAFGISVTSGGSVYRQKIGGGESIDISATAANSVTFTHSASSGGGIIAFICFSGSASEA